MEKCMCVSACVFQFLNVYKTSNVTADIRCRFSLDVTGEKYVCLNEYLQIYSLTTKECLGTTQD